MRTLSLLFISVLASACLMEDTDDWQLEAPAVDEGDAKADGACSVFGTSYGAYWKTCRITGQQSALLDGEVVFTIDDGIGSSTAAMAETLHAGGVSGTFFPATHNLGRSERLERLDIAALQSLWPQATSLSLDRSAVINELAWIPRLGHTVANHTYSHPIAQPSRGIPSFRDMRPDQRQRAEVVDSHELLVGALTLLDAEAGFNGTAQASLLRFFRSPGNSWDEHAARVLSVEPLREYRGPVGWDLPASGEEDFRCWSEGLSVAQCGERFIAAYRRMPTGQQRAIILLHEHPKSVQLASYLISRFRELSAAGTKAGNCIKFVPLRCTVGCTRALLPAQQQRCAHQR